MNKEQYEGFSALLRCRKENLRLRAENEELKNERLLLNETHRLDVQEIEQLLSEKYLLTDEVERLEDDLAAALEKPMRDAVTYAALVEAARTALAEELSWRETIRTALEAIEEGK